MYNVYIICMYHTYNLCNLMHLFFSFSNHVLWYILNFRASTLPVVWIRWSHWGAFTGWAEITVVPLMGGARVCRGRKTVSLPFYRSNQRHRCVENCELHAFGTTSKWLWARLTVDTLVSVNSFCKVKQNKNHESRVEGRKKGVYVCRTLMVTSKQLNCR